MLNKVLIQQKEWIMDSFYWIFMVISGLWIWIICNGDLLPNENKFSNNFLGVTLYLVICSLILLLPCVIFLIIKLIKIYLIWNYLEDKMELISNEIMYYVFIAFISITVGIMIYTGIKEVKEI